MCQYCLHLSKFSIRIENGDLVDVCRKHYMEITALLKTDSDMESLRHFESDKVTIDPVEFSRFIKERVAR